MWKVLFCVVTALELSHGAKETNREPKSKGVGAFAYQDSAGNRYGGTYGLNDGQVVNRMGDDIPPFLIGNFGDNFAGNFAGNYDEAANNFFPEYFRNFENILQDSPRLRRHIILLPHAHHFIEPLPPLQPLPPLEPLPPLRPLPRLLPHLPPLFPPLEPLSSRTALPSPLIPDHPMSHFGHLHERAFQYNYEGQQLALNAARKAFDVTSNYAGYIPNFASRFAPPAYNPGSQGFQGFPGSPGYNGFGAPNFDTFGQNSAFAYGALGPDYSHQIAALNPENPEMKNVNVMNRFGEVDAPTRRDFKSVSSASFSSSKNINGKQENERSASTIINDNGKITKYEVHS